MLPRQCWKSDCRKMVQYKVMMFTGSVFSCEEHSNHGAMRIYLYFLMKFLLRQWLSLKDLWGWAREIAVILWCNLKQFVSSEDRWYRKKAKEQGGNKSSAPSLIKQKALSAKDWLFDIPTVGAIIAGVILFNILWLFHLSSEIAYSEARMKVMDARLQSIQRTLDKQEFDKQTESLEKAKAEREKTSVSRGIVRGNTQTFIITAFSTDPRECSRSVYDPNYARTASGYVLSQKDAYKYVAVDNRLIKFGTRMIIHAPGGDIHAIAADTGGAIQGNRIDLFVGYVSREEDELRRKTGQEPKAVLDAMKWGRRTLKVTVID